MSQVRFCHVLPIDLFANEYWPCCQVCVVLAGLSKDEQRDYKELCAPPQSFVPHSLQHSLCVAQSNQPSEPAYHGLSEQNAVNRCEQYWMVTR